jgi:hypothetical protein
VLIGLGSVVCASLLNPRRPVAEPHPAINAEQAVAP